MGDNNMQMVLSCSKDVQPQYVEMMVPLYSYGCEKKIKKTLSHLKGIYSVNVDYKQQKVTVWGICNKNDVLATVRSKRKVARFWNPDDNKNLVTDQETEQQQEQEPEQITRPPKKLSLSLSLPTQLALPSLPLKDLKLSFKLTRARSLSLKAWKKVFTRSNSF